MTYFAAFGERQTERDRRAAGFFGIITGIFVLLIFLIPGPTTGTTAQEQLNSFSWNVAVAGYILNGVVLIFSALFIIYLRAAFLPKSPTLSTAAAFFFLAGVLILAASTFYTNSAMATLSSIYKSSTATAADKAAAVVSAQIVQNNGVGALGFGIGLPIGVVLFSIVFQNSRIVPNWLGDVGFAFAILLPVAFVIFSFASAASAVSFVIFLAFIVLLLLWIFGTGAFLLRSARKVAVGEPTPT